MTAQSAIRAVLDAHHWDQGADLCRCGLPIPSQSDHQAAAILAHPFTAAERRALAALLTPSDPAALLWEAAWAYLDAQQALVVWDAKHGYVTNSERDALSMEVSVTEAALRGALEAG